MVHVAIWDGASSVKKEIKQTQVSLYEQRKALIVEELQKKNRNANNSWDKAVSLRYIEMITRKEGNVEQLIFGERTKKQGEKEEKQAEP